MEQKHTSAQAGKPAEISTGISKANHAGNIYPRFEIDRMLDSLAYKTKSREKNRQSEILNILSDCLDRRKMVYMEVATGHRSKRKVLFEPYLLGMDYMPLYGGLFVFGKHVFSCLHSIYQLGDIKSIEVAVTSYSVIDMKVSFGLTHNEVIRKIDELKIVQNTDTTKEKIDDTTSFAEDLSEFNNQPCLVCGSQANCRHLRHLQRQFRQEQAERNRKIKFSNLIQYAMTDHPKFIVIPYFSKDEVKARKFSSIKRKAWRKTHFSLFWQLSDFMSNPAVKTFRFVSTIDRKYWAMFYVGFPTRIYAIAEIIGEKEPVAERVAARMMALYSYYEDQFVSFVDMSGDVNAPLLEHLYYEHENKRLNS